MGPPERVSTKLSHKLCPLATSATQTWNPLQQPVAMSDKLPELNPVQIAAITGGDLTKSCAAAVVVQSALRQRDPVAIRSSTVRG